MKERPILFNDEMVSAILAGRKTQTRRIIKRPFKFIYGLDGKPIGVCTSTTTYCDVRGFIQKECPYGAVGDRLWVREAWLRLAPDHFQEPDRPANHLSTRYDVPRVSCVAYRSDCSSESDQLRKEYGYHWRPSIHMPRWASRITLEMTRVKVERLQDISEEDAISEGIESLGNKFFRDYLSNGAECVDMTKLKARDSFATLWDSIYAERGYSWESNPGVWVVEFRRVL
jgi:hypothetical protein